MKIIIVLALLAGVVQCQVPVTRDDVTGLNLDITRDEPSFGPFIIDGQPSVYGDHPYMCSLQMFSEGDWSYHCGAAIYNELTIMTTATCVNGQVASDLRVACGDYNLFSVDEFEVIEQITEIRSHPRYQLDSDIGFPANIAVLRVERPLVFNAFVNTLPIPKKTQELTDCQVVGWGVTALPDVFPDVLQEADSNLLSNKECAVLWGRRRISFEHACFLDPVACRGDAGSPAVCRDASGDQKFLVGLASWGNSSCPEFLPAVYTRLSFYSRWLNENAFSDYKDKHNAH